MTTENSTPPHRLISAAFTMNGRHRMRSKFRGKTFWAITAAMAAGTPTIGCLCRRFCENRNLDVIREALHNELGMRWLTNTRLIRTSCCRLYQQGADLSNLQLNAGASGNPAKLGFRNVRRSKFLNHQGGCGGTRQDAAILSKLLALCRSSKCCRRNHPEPGCQNLQTQSLLDDIRSRNPKFDKLPRIRTTAVQKGRTADRRSDPRYF